MSELVCVAFEGRHIAEQCTGGQAQGRPRDQRVTTMAGQAVSIN